LFFQHEQRADRCHIKIIVKNLAAPKIFFLEKLMAGFVFFKAGEKLFECGLS